MAIPDDSLNPQAPIGNFLSPDDLDRADLTRDYELGGPTLNQPSDGVPTTFWDSRLELSGDISIGHYPSGDRTVIISPTTDCTEVSFCFDSNNRPHLAWVDEGLISFYWYDTQSESTVTSTFSAGHSNPRLCLDDKRELQSQTRDILFLYVRDLALYYRQQRDRYTNERKLTDLPINFLRLGRFGMAKSNRVQIELITDGDPVYA